MGSGVGLLPDGTKPTPKPVFTYQLQGSVAFTREQFHKKCIRIKSVTWIRKLNLLPHLPETNALICHQSFFQCCLIFSTGPLDRPMSVPVSSPHGYNLQAPMATASSPLDPPVPTNGSLSSSLGSKYDKLLPAHTQQTSAMNMHNSKSERQIVFRQIIFISVMFNEQDG